MSEYQYYEFRAIDRAAMAKLRSISSRAEITSRGLVNEYHWGDFKGNVEKLVEEHFDAHLYLANWGTHRLVLRVPVALLPLSATKPFTTEEGLRAWATDTHTVIDFHSESEGDHEWTEGEGQLDQVLPVREELLAGDLRALYIGWLATLDSQEALDEDALEPPVPPGLRKPTEAQLSLATYLRVDDDLLDVAAESSAAHAPAGPKTAEIAAWVSKLPNGEKTDALVRVLEGEGAAVAAELLGRFRADPARAKRAEPEGARRTVRELLAAREMLAEKNRRLAAESRARETARREREAAEARERHLNSLAGKEPALWKEVEAAAETKLPKQYDHALQLLKDLRELAERAGTESAFAARVVGLRERHQKKPAFIKRLNGARMPE